MDFLLTQSPVPHTPIFVDEHEHFVVVDAVDHAWLSQWVWSACWSKPRPGHKLKLYARRTFRLGGRLGKPIWIYLHKEVCRRAHGEAPPGKPVGDHMDGNEIDCRRHNMRWASKSENRLNLDGAYARQLQLDLKRRFA